MRRLHLVLIVVLAVSVGACSKQIPEVSANDQVPADLRVEEVDPDAEGGEGEPADAGDADALWVAGADLAYSDTPAEVPADGALLALELTGGTPHNVVFEGFEGDRVLVEGPGEGVYTSEVTIPAGDYTYYCNIAGHRAAGMEGQVTVAEGVEGGGGASEGAASEGEGGASEDDESGEEATESA